MRVKSKLTYPFRIRGGMTIEPGKEYELPDDVAQHLLIAKMVRKISDTQKESSPKKKGGRK